MTPKPTLWEQELHEHVRGVWEAAAVVRTFVTAIYETP